MVTGYITNGSTYTSSTKTLYSGSVTGGDSPVYTTSTFLAPITPGIYTLKVRIEGYIPNSYPSILDFTRNYELPFSVIAPISVELSINGSRANPQTIVSGDPVEVKWIAQNATGGCTCSTNTPVRLYSITKPLANYCGNSAGGLGSIPSSKFDIYGVTSQTVFTVSCNND